MATYVPAKRATEYIFWVGLVSQANTKILQGTPTIAAGDFKVSIDGGALNNLATLPTVTPAASKMVKITLSTSEMTGDNITVVCSDAAGAEWCDLLINIQTAARQIDDLTWPTVSGRSLDVSTTGEAGLDWANIGSPTTAQNLSGTNIDVDQVVASVSGAVGSVTGAVGSVASGGITAASIATDAIDADAIAVSGANKIVQAVSGTADAGSSATLIVDAERTESVTDYWINSIVRMTSGAAIHQERRITAFNTTTDTLTVAPAFMSAVAAGDTYIILGTAEAGPVASVAGNVDGNVTGSVASVTGNVSGNVTGSVGSVAANGITASSIATDAIDADAIAADAIGASEFAQAAADKVWSSATRTLTAFSTALALSVWDVLETAILTASSIGLKLKNNLDVVVSTRATPAQVNTEVVDALSVDTYTEPGQEAPAATNTLAVKIGYLFKAWRNRSTQTSTQYSLYNDDATTLAHKSTVSDDATTFDRGEVGTGP